MSPADLKSLHKKQQLLKTTCITTGWHPYYLSPNSGVNQLNKSKLMNPADLEAQQMSPADSKVIAKYLICRILPQSQQQT